MSSLYYQHQQHEQQRDLQREREEAQHYPRYHQQQQSYHSNSQHPSQSHSQSHSQHFHYQQHSHSHSHSYPNHQPPSSYSQSHSNSNDFASIDREASQSLQASREETLDKLRAMIYQEESGYHLDSYFPPEVPRNGSLPRQQNIIHGGWREKICQWSYNVVDHFDLPREIVSISLNYFDRYMASLSNAEDIYTANASTSNGRMSPQGSSGDLALLASLGTLHLATKVHATNHNDYDPLMGPLEEQHHKVPSLSTLANLSRGQFGPSSILEMEKLLLGALRWRLHPPTLFCFVTFFLQLIPNKTQDNKRGILPTISSELFEVAMYVAELSVCDAFFVERQIPSSVIALAAICTAMDDLLEPKGSDFLGGLNINVPGSGCFTEDHRSSFLNCCRQQLGLGTNQLWFEETLQRLRSMYSGAAALKNGSGSVANESQHQNQQQQSSSQSQQSQSRSRTNSYNPPTSPSSIADMSLSTINSTIHSMAETTTNGGSSYKRNDSMVSSIQCNKSNGDEDLMGHKNENDEDDDEQHSVRSHHSNNFRYSPSPPRDEAVAKPKVYGYDEAYPGEHQQHPLRRNQSGVMSCSPIVPLH